MKVKKTNKPFKWHEWEPPVISLDEAIRRVKDRPWRLVITVGQKGVGLSGEEAEIDCTPSEAATRLRELGWHVLVPEGGRCAHWMPYQAMDAFGRP